MAPAAARTTTPPPRPALAAAQSPITPEQVRRMEEARLRAKALRSQQQQAAAAATTATTATTTTRSEVPRSAVAGQKRPYSAIVTRNGTSEHRDARNNAPTASSGDDGIRAARKFQKFVEYDFSQMTDTKGGFMTREDDPHNRTLHADREQEGDGRPANMTLREWEQQRLRQKLREQRQGPYEPGISVLEGGKEERGCVECGSREIDWQWEEVLGMRVCQGCKTALPEKYSLLTKTEAKADYLLTDAELRDEALLPRLERPNPHKATWNSMMLYLRCQVEEYAFSERKWGSADALDAEFERRTAEAKERKERKFRNKLQELKKRTRVDAYKRGRAGGGGEFGDTIGSGRHEHEWGRSVEDPETGMTKKTCVECGMEVEELEL